MSGIKGLSPFNGDDLAGITNGVPNSTHWDKITGTAPGKKGKKQNIDTYKSKGKPKTYIQKDKAKGKGHADSYFKSSDKRQYPDRKIPDKERTGSYTKEGKRSEYNKKKNNGVKKCTK